ncbi:aspartic peptidase domain-containing protein [Mucor mucedo]|uniref:aspartic peptidase domain-containing protein n=1 Tax=Mucor mucedo TaxID=29922 RepID=UPI00222102A3|nr:aspartic peptidase domain-containing protein [Mucor mucedo]KAI7875822.1 aspartic peptidase domain-containing protein [Mucor mucedo]
MGDFGSIDWSKTKYNFDISDVAPIPNPFSGVFRSKRASGDSRYSVGAASSGSSGFRKRGPLIDSVLSSSFFILGVDKSFYKGPVYELPLIPLMGFRSPFWKIPVTGFQFLNMNATYQSNPQFSFPSGAYGKIDSSSPVLTVPSATADKMNSALGAVYNANLNVYTIPCSFYETAPWLTIQFGIGVKAHIPPSQYIYKFEGANGGCYTAIAGGSDSQNVYLGGPFFRSFYLIFHYSGFNVGIAESLSNESGRLTVDTNGGGPVPKILN